MSRPPSTNKPLADVALLLEGTYPYVSGGVSSWVHQIIRGLPEITFALVFLGGDPRHYGKQRYELPKNVVHLTTHYLMAAGRLGVARLRPGDAARFADSAALHEYLRGAAAAARGGPPASLDPALLPRLFASLGQPGPGGISVEDFLLSEAAWRQVCGDYERLCTDPSFVDYFWTVRMMHAPLFQLATLARSLAPCRAYHAISTGYAGLLGALLRHRQRRPFILTEHGIYTKERKIDLAQAEWIKEPPDAPRASFGSGAGGLGYTRGLWIRFFEGLGRLTYDAADPVVSLYEGNRQRQIQDGARRERTLVVPNGIDLARFAPLRARRSQEIPPVLGLLGRVVPIKDIKTFIRAMRGVVNRLPQAEGWIIGPTDEDPAYARECEALVRSLGLTERVKFLGFQKPEDILPKLGLMVLTSISEALPLVLLEGFASGLPALATDVGACREILNGGSPADQALGSAGAVVHIADPDATARAALSLLQDPQRWHAAQAAGIARVERFYTQAAMLDAYRDIYRRAIDSAELRGAPSIDSAEPRGAPSIDSAEPRGAPSIDAPDDTAAPARPEPP